MVSRIYTDAWYPVHNSKHVDMHTYNSRNNCSSTATKNKPIESKSAVLLHSENPDPTPSQTKSTHSQSFSERQTMHPPLDTIIRYTKHQLSREEEYSSRGV